MNEKRALPGNDLSLKLPSYTARGPEQPASATPFRTTFASLSMHMRDWILLFVSSWGAEKTEARRLLCQILHDTLLFRYQQPPPPSCIWMSISFDRGDLLHLIDAPQDLGRLLVQAYGEKVQNYQFKGSVFEIKFRGYPWRAYGTDTVQTRLILLTLLECLEQQGFKLYASIDPESLGLTACQDCKRAKSGSLTKLTPSAELICNRSLG
ncbi:hypothetical protein V1524DRAFT_472682 [Lipomyces starkeyi]